MAARRDSFVPTFVEKTGAHAVITLQRLYQVQHVGTALSSSRAKPATTATRTILMVSRVWVLQLFAAPSSPFCYGRHGLFFETCVMGALSMKRTLDRYARLNSQCTKPRPTERVRTSHPFLRVPTLNHSTLRMQCPLPD